jgi:two-component system KDP operon response regulator KdpE
MTANPPTALLVEDERQIRLRPHGVETEGWNVVEAETLKRACRRGHAQARPRDLDLGLPDGNGIDFIHGCAVGRRSR